MDPRYRDVKAAEIPEVLLDSGVRIKVVSGRVNGTEGPVRDIVIDPEMLDVSVPAGTTYRHPVKAGHTAIAYVLDGHGWFDERRDPFAYEMAGAGWMDLERPCVCGPETVVLYERDGSDVVVTTGESPVRFLFIAGKPLGEPVAWYGPIVMNTQEELKVAFEEYEKGTFIKQR
jgi:redox-sensitive bicupin YhaK (pirin superfamily)